MADSFDLPQAFDVLEQTPSVLRALLQELDHSWLETRPTPAAWSPQEVLAHLLFGEQVDWLPRALIILEHADRRPFETFDRTGHSDLARRPVAQLLDQFAERRAQNLKTLRDMNLSQTDLSRRGRHPQLGTVTLGQLLATWVVHDLNHLDQIARTMAHRYQHQTGPWNHPDYLGILHRIQRR